MLNKLMVCLDGSALAEEIIPVVTDIAKCFAGTVVLFQAIDEPTTYVSPSLPRSGDDVSDVLRRKSKDDEYRALGYLEKMAKPLRDEGLDIECATLMDEASKAILQYASENSVKLIAIATHGHGGLKRMFFGSVADKVLRQSGVPVLVIKSQKGEG
ncbi:universal stress protein [Chloroflexota bacterium]